MLPDLCCPELDLTHVDMTTWRSFYTASAGFGCQFVSESFLRPLSLCGNASTASHQHQSAAKLQEICIPVKVSRVDD